MPTVTVSWSTGRPATVYAGSARAIAQALAAATGASPADVLVYFDDLPAGELYVDKVPFGRKDGEQ